MISLKRIGVGLLTIGAICSVVGAWAIRWWFGLWMLSIWLVVAGVAVLIRAGFRWIVNDSPKMVSDLKARRREAEAIVREGRIQ